LSHDRPEVTPTPRRSTSTRRAVSLLAAALLVIGLLAGALLAPLPGGALDEARAAGKGVVDYRLESLVVDLAAVPAMVDEMGKAGLNARWTRILVRWARLQPQAPGTAYADDANGDHLP